MKRIKNYLLGVNIAVLLIISAGCKEYTTKTKINPDGSCERVVIVEGDTSGITSLPFPVPVDKSWKIEKRKSEKDSSKVVYSAEKSFTDVNSLNAEYSNQDKIGVKINFEKKFRWFYTYYEYEETYKSYFPYRMIPLKKYLSTEEYQKFIDGDTTKVLNERLQKYAGENYLEYFLTEFLKVCKEKEIYTVTEASIREKRNAIFEFIDHHDNNSKTLASFLATIFKSESIKGLEPFFETIVNEVEKKMEWAGSADGTYTNQISMPGVILSTNSKSVKGNTVEWKVDSWRFQFEDFVMRVESRSANVSVFVITGIIFVASLLLLIVPRLKRNNV